MNKIKHTCSGETQYAPCIRYEGTVNEQSKLSNQDCLDLDQTTKDIYEQIGSILEDSLLEALGDNCITYTLEEGKLKIKKVLQEFEKEICNLKEEVETLKSTAICDYSITDCDLDFSGLTNPCGDSPTKLKDVLQLILNNIRPE